MDDNYYVFPIGGLGSAYHVSDALPDPQKRPVGFAPAAEPRVVLPIERRTRPPRRIPNRKR